MVVDPGAVVLAVVVIVFVVLIGLVVRKMARGQINPPEEADRLEPGEQRAELEALEREALGEGVAEPERVPVPEQKKPTALTKGLEKTRKGFMARINELLVGRKL